MSLRLGLLALGALIVAVGCWVAAAAQPAKNAKSADKKNTNPAAPPATMASI